MITAQRRVIVPLAIAPAAPALGAAVHTLRGRSMGTTWCVKLSGPRAVDATRLQHAVQACLDTVVAEMSPWESGSDISRFNAAPAGHWQALPAGFAQVLEGALTVAARSGGAFDPTAGELVDLWGFGPAGRVHRRPAPEALAAAHERTGWQRLAWQDGRLRQPGGQRLDLSAIAKGFGVDQISRTLQRLGFDNHLVEVGGELRGSGIRPDGQPWWVDLQLPPRADGLAETRVALHGLSVATSGDYLRCFDDEHGIHHSHSIDPRSGEPVAHGLASVSVLHAECLWADAWSTALTVLGPVHGPALARELGLAALFVTRGADGAWDEQLSPALAEMAGD